MQTAFCQFMKSGESGEVTIFDQIPNIRYHCPGKHPFILSKGPEEVHYAHAQKAMEFAFGAVKSGAHVLICDEVLDTVLFGILEKAELIRLIERCRKRVELVLTGRDAPPEVFDLADYVTQFVQVKHPYYCGSKARKGIEY
jgi:cob(I)alamin adenosyltransferase